MSQTQWRQVNIGPAEFEIPEEWELKRLKDIAEIQSSNVNKKTYEDETPVQLCNYLEVYRNEFITSEMDFMASTADDREIERFKLQKGDVIITKDSEEADDIAQPAVVLEELDNVICGYHLVIIRPENDSIDGRFLSRMLDSKRINDQFSALSQGLTRFSLTVSSIESAKVILPPPPEQKKIAVVLSKVDEAIQQTEQIIEKTQELKQGLMQDLFTKGLDHDEFKEVAIGPKRFEIPFDWDVVKIADICRVKRGASPRPIGDEKYFGGDTGWVRISDLDESEKYLTETADYLSELGVQESVKVYPDEVLVSISATVGRPCIVKMRACIHDGLVAFKDLKAEKVHHEFLYYMLEFTQSRLLAKGQTGTQSNVNSSLVRNTFILLPPLPEQKQIAKILSKVDQKIQSEKTYRDKLKELKRGLMQELLTGKVRLNEVNLDGN